MSASRPNSLWGRVGAFVLIAIGLVASGCATTSATHAVRITAAAEPTSKFGYAYLLAKDSAGRAATDPFHVEMTERIRTALAQRGMYEAFDPNQADVIVSFDYGEHPPYTQVTTVTEPVLMGPGSMGPGLGMGGASIPPLASGPGLPAGHPSVVMVETLRITRTSEKYLRLDGRANTEDKKRIWSVDATVEDEGTPIAECIPAMVDAVIEYIGAVTPQPETLVITLGPDGPRR